MVARRSCRLEFSKGELREAVMRGKLFEESGINPVTGDLVFAEEHHGQWMVEKVLPRTNEYIRQGLRHERQVMFANVNRVLILASLAEPRTKATSLDRFLVAALTAEIPVSLVFTKTDLDENLERAHELTRIYAAFQLKTFPLCNTTGEGIEALQKHIHKGITALVGNSGVGKTSLLNNLIPGLEMKVRDVSSWSGKGVHTTTAAMLLRLPESSASVLDTPGMKSFVPYGIDEETLLGIFPDIHSFSLHCKFSDCRHITEPGCKVLEAAEEGKIPEIRLTSYHRLLEGLAEA